MVKWLNKYKMSTETEIIRKNQIAALELKLQSPGWKMYQRDPTADMRWQKRQVNSK